MIGNRRDDARFHDLEPGEYAVKGQLVYICLPYGARIAVPHGGDGWTLIEETDGSATLDPSILVHPVPGVDDGWHGWLRAGELVTA